MNPKSIICLLTGIIIAHFIVSCSTGEAVCPLEPDPNSGRLFSVSNNVNDSSTVYFHYGTSDSLTLTVVNTLNDTIFHLYQITQDSFIYFNRFGYFKVITDGMQVLNIQTLADPPNSIQQSNNWTFHYNLNGNLELVDIDFMVNAGVPFNEDIDNVQLIPKFDSGNYLQSTYTFQNHGILTNDTFKIEYTSLPYSCDIPYQLPYDRFYFGNTNYGGLPLRNAESRDYLKVAGFKVFEPNTNLISTLRYTNEEVTYNYQMENARVKSMDIHYANALPDSVFFSYEFSYYP